MPEPEAENAIEFSTVGQAGAEAMQVASGEAPDEQLMARYARGDAGAFEELYRRYRGPVFRFILRSVSGDRGTAEDLFHDVMMKVIGAAQRYEPSAKFNTWIFRIARNTCIDAARKRKFEPKKRLSDPVSSEVEDMTTEDVIGDSEAGPEELASDSETRQAITEVLNEMNTNQREVFLLREVEGLPFQEVAKIARCTESTAKSRMRYALSFLANGLKERGITP